MGWQDESMHKTRLLTLIQQEQAALETLLAALDPARLTQPGVYDELSVKDVLAHLAAWQAMETGWLRATLRGEPVVRYAPGYELTENNIDIMTDRINSRIFAENQDKPFAAVLDDLRNTHTGLLETVQALSDDDLRDPHRFDWWDGEPIWTSIAGNSYEHVRQHRALIESWLTAGGSIPKAEQE